MPDQNLQLVRTAFDPFRANSVRAAQVGLVGTDTQDEGKYRRLTAKSERDLKPLEYMDVCKKAFYLWQRNPLAKRELEVLVDFCIGDDLKVKVRTMKRNKDGDEVLKDRKEGQLVWDDFFEDPMNGLQDELDSMFVDHLINGEMVIPAVTNKTNGKVWLGYLDPKYILAEKGVIPVSGNIRVIDRLLMKPPDSTESKEFKVIRWNMDGNPKTNKNYGRLTGDLFFFQINKIPTQLRGYSIIVDHIDWLDAFDQFAFGALDGADARNDYFFDCKMEGESQTDLDKIKVTRPDRGQVNLHNEKSTWTVITPQLGANEIESLMKTMKENIVGSKGFPMTWFGSGDTANRATAEAMTIPTMRMLKRMQGIIKRELKFMALYVLQQSQEYGTLRLAADEYFDIEVSAFEIEQKGVDAMGSGFSQFMSALSVGVAKGWVSDDNAKKVVDGILSSIGIEVDASETADMLAEKNKEKEVQNLAEDTLNQAPPVGDFLEQQRRKAGIGEFANKERKPVME
jgi:hypothetical protein